MHLGGEVNRPLGLSLKSVVATAAAPPSTANSPSVWPIDSSASSTKVETDSAIPSSAARAI